MKPDWKDAPKWATVMLVNVICKSNPSFCWADSELKAMCPDTGIIFELLPECWQVYEYRPAITLDNHQEALPKVGDKLLYSLGMDIWYECEIKYVVPNYGVVALCQPIDGECEQWLDTTTKFKPLPLTEEEKYEELLRDVSQHCSWYDITNHLYKLGYHK